VEYVMVPVPEELADKVLTYVSWRDAQAKAGPPADEGPPNGEAITRVFGRLDDPSRALLAVVAIAAVEGEELGVPDAARRAGVTAREALGILLEVNNILVGQGAPPISFGGRDVGAPAGEFTWEAWTIVMPEAIGAPILELARPPAPG
jgi:hypothetical protein